MVSLVGFSILGGIVGSICCGYFIEKMKVRKKFKKLLYLTSLASVLSFIMFNLSLITSNIYLLFATGFIHIMCNYPWLTLGVELACIISYPIAEGLVSGIL